MEFTPINSIRDYFEINFKVLHQGGRYTLPGYKVEDGVFTGMNDVILPNVEIAPPVLMGDNVLLQRGCELAGEVIIGTNVIVDNDCYLKSCIVFDNSYIREGMEMVNKIVSSQLIIDPCTGAFILIADDCFVSEMRNIRSLKMPVFCWSICCLGAGAAHDNTIPAITHLPATLRQAQPAFL